MCCIGLYSNLFHFANLWFCIKKFYEKHFIRDNTKLFLGEPGINFPVIRNRMLIILSNM